MPLAKLHYLLIGLLLLGRVTPAAAPPGWPPGGALDVLHYHFILALPPTGAVVQGRAELRVARRAPADTLRLDLLADLHVDSVLVNGHAVPFGRTAAGLQLPLPPRPAGAGPDTLAVAVRYGGTPRVGLAITTDSQGRWSAFGDNWPTRARGWLPCVDNPADKATVRWTVTAPAALRVVANGQLLAETPLPADPSRVRTTWLETRPIATYLMVLAAAELARVPLPPVPTGQPCARTEAGSCVEQVAYVWPESRAGLPGPFTRSGAILAFYSRLIAPFPYEKLAHVQSATVFGGMENASAIFYPDFRAHPLRESTVAHEMAHQWFGDAVTERRWADVWLSEGFATYFELLWTEHADGVAAFRARLANNRTRVLRDSVAQCRPVLDTLQTNLLQLLNVNSYQKGGWVLHQLRREVGDSAFFRGLRLYYQAHRHGTALTADVQRAVEQTSGQQLGWFFEQWLRRPGTPSLRVRWQQRGRRLTLEVQQNGRPYRLPLSFDALDAAGHPARYTVRVPAQAQASLRVQLGSKVAVSSLVFDPDVDLLGTVTVVK